MNISNEKYRGATLTSIVNATCIYVSQKTEDQNLIHHIQRKFTLMHVYLSEQSHKAPFLMSTLISHSKYEKLRCNMNN